MFTVEQNMKAAIYHAPGAPAVLDYADVPDPTPADGQILVRIEAISIEGGDLVNRARTVPQDPLMPLGYAASGEVIALGPNASGFAIGDKVATFAFLGSHGELRAVSAKTCWKVPAGLDMGVAAAIPCGPGTAWHVLKHAKLQAGQTVLIQGAAGGVGVAAVQLAHQLGARVIGTGTNPATLDKLKPLGLDDAVVVSDGPVADQVLALTGGRGVDLVLDNIGGAAVNEALACCRDGASVVLIGVLGDIGERVDPVHLLRHRITLVGCLFGAVLHEPEEHAGVAELLDAAAAGRFTVPIDKEFRLDDAAAAHAYAQTRGRIGRVIIRP